MTETRTVKSEYCPAVPLAKDMRTTVRYALCAIATFRWIDRAGAAHEGHGETRDISPKGVFIVCQRCPPPGALLAVQIQVPVVGVVSRDASIRAEGEVLRVELKSSAQNGTGFAIQNHWMRYANCE